MNFRATCLLLLAVCAPSVVWSAGYGIATGGGNVVTPGTHQSVTYRGRAAQYTVVAVLHTNGVASAAIHHFDLIVGDGPLYSGVGSNSPNRRIHVSLGEAGYLKGRIHRNQPKITARLVLRTGDKVLRRACVLKWVPPVDSSYSVEVRSLPAPPQRPRWPELRPVPFPPPYYPGTTNANTVNGQILTREEAEAVIEARRQTLLRSNITSILPPAPMIPATP